MATVKEGYELIRIHTGVGYMSAIKNKVTGEEMPVLPLNGWRGRNLAFTIFGERNAGLWRLGVSKLVKVDELASLPGWDDADTAHLRKFTGVVCIEVACVETGGSYITVEQMGVAADIRYWAQQERMLVGRFKDLGIKIDEEKLALVAAYVDTTGGM